MSTKSSLAFGPSFHLYYEMFDAGAVWLDLDRCEFRCSDRGISVRIPFATWEFLRAFPAIEFTLAKKSNRELRKLARQQAKESSAASAKAKVSDKRMLLFMKRRNGVQRILSRLLAARRTQRQVLKELQALKEEARRPSRRTLSSIVARSSPPP